MDKTEKITNIATKRGFFFPSGEIYAVKAGFWTYGHLGTLLKQKYESIWRSYFLSLDPNYYEIDDVNILTKEVFESSGHLKNFNDPLTECKSCKNRFRADELIEEKGTNAQGLSDIELSKLIKRQGIKCPNCNSDLGPVKMFNMMFEIKVGATGKNLMYLRPETAQSPYLAFKREFLALREKLPMGLAVIGKSFRNEISPRQGFFRLREFTQSELQIFLDPDKLNQHEDFEEIKNYKVIVKFHDKELKEYSCKELNKLDLPKFYVYHMAKIQEFYLETLEIPKKLFRFRELPEKERAFYNKLHFDIELNLETLNGFKEIGGLHYRGSHDLGGHQESSKTKLEVTIDNKKFIPHVLELSFGVDRAIWALLDIFYKEEKERTLFAFPYKLSPIDVAIFPLVKKDNLPDLARDIFHELRKDFTCTYDETGSIGKMYRRVDEIGGPFMITVDHQTIKDSTVTLRERETMQQIRVKISELKDTIEKLLNHEIEFTKAGKKV